ncbi:SHOCT domain-containing protein [Streptomyces sp. MUM 203J]|uniref:SHOCT domain-containing protein n=1 Tax=Streptomyces sp. MUM 203J TaxID=2791990 RepID=UPI001F0341FF|nr:SHOCT domain-containing protein [Streptomyces sp. MUM 203J]MCH0543379.1 SHOCT domain-containing protein [Streptomyces sp. MUM 203J]
MDDYPLLDLFWTMFWFFIWILWLFLLFRVIMDLFRDHELNGWAKAGWLVLCIVLPYLGVLLYVIVRGRSMGRREAQQARENEAAFKAYVREAAGQGEGGGAKRATHVDELARLAELKEKGALSEEEFQRAKDKLLAS